MSNLVLVDGNSIMNRAFYGIMSSKMLTTSDGTWSMDYWDNYSSEQKQQILNNGIEIQYDVYLDSNLSNALVSIIPKQGMTCQLDEIKKAVPDFKKAFDKHLQIL